MLSPDSPAKTLGFSSKPDMLRGIVGEHVLGTMTNTQQKIDETHKVLGEFVVIFQRVENLYREIGWFILDPDRHRWPPTELRKEVIGNLINTVTDLFVNLTETFALENGQEKAGEMKRLCERFHEFRKLRNRLLHSTYIELRGGGEVHGYFRSNPQPGVDSETGELIVDQENFTADSIYGELRGYSHDIFSLGLIKTQLIHWYPFARH